MLTEIQGNEEFSLNIILTFDSLKIFCKTMKAIKYMTLIYLYIYIILIYNNYIIMTVKYKYRGPNKISIMRFIKGRY